MFQIFDGSSILWLANTLEIFKVYSMGCLCSSQWRAVIPRETNDAIGSSKVITLLNAMHSNLPTLCVTAQLVN